MEQWAEIRRRVLIEQVSQRQILRETGMHWKTLKKILQHNEPSGYRREVPFSKPRVTLATHETRTNSSPLPCTHRVAV